MDTETEKLLQALDSVRGADDIYYDAATGRITSQDQLARWQCLRRLDPDHFQLLGKVPTEAVSKTGLWVPELKRFYSAVRSTSCFTVPMGQKIRATAKVES